jgi:putative ABC transport system permease protein
MNALTFIRRGIWHFKLSYLGVWAGAVLGATVLLGALLAGDSVKETLREVARNRVGKIDQIFIAGEGFFRDELAAEVRGAELRSAPVLLLKGQLSSQESGRALGQVQILGVDESFWDFAPSDGMALELPDREVAVNDHLAARDVVS